MFWLSAVRAFPLAALVTGAACFPVSFLHAEPVDFSREVLPILSENCFHCHGPDAKKRKADLRLDTAEGATLDLGDGYAALIPGKPQDSILVNRIESRDPDEIMPPHDSGKALSASQRLTLRHWIADGAKYEAHWAFQPIQNSEPPSLKGNQNLTNIDRFIVAALKKRGLSLSEPISKNQLIRRATFDLTGLPPTWSDVENFVSDSSPNAFEKVIDRLLDSPAYGERWGRHWLDLARYADTHGGSAIGFKRFAFSYTYRDYVIAALGKDLPYDRFLLEQIAADQLKLEENDPTLAALGFLTVGRQFRNVHDRIDDHIDVISRGLLGLTVTCARCHDHKFDPIPTTDYYSLHATLASSRVPEELPKIGKLTESGKYQPELKKLEQLRDDITREQGQVMRGRLRVQVGMYLQELAKGTPEQDTSTFFLSYRTDDIRPVVLERWRSHLKMLTENDPVFGPWHKMAEMKAEDFENQSQALLQKLIKENGDPKKFASEQTLTTKPPKWNPRVLDALTTQKPKSYIEVAKIYGDVFSKAHQRWMTSLLEASTEAVPGGKIVADQDKKHRIINSSIERQLRHHLYDPGTPTAISFEDSENLRMLNRGVRDSVGRTGSSIHSLNLTTTAPPRAMVLSENKEQPKESFVFLRGNPIQRGERVEARFLSALSGENPPTFSEGQRRLDLARAIVDPNNPLTRRVIANWVWQHHFGRGLVRTADDFGTRGSPPSHPKLLDYLATKLLEDQWSLKKLHRRIMLSAVYQQAPIENKTAREKDPLNTLLWRMPTRKLEMESMRDALLSVSDELDTTPGGQPFDEKGGKAIPRRSVYAFVNRDVISRMAATFDGADPSACTVQRQETMVPQQTLFALNSDFVRNRASALVQLPEIQQAKSDQDRIRLIYQRLFSRPPVQDEIDIALSYLGKSKNREPEVWPRFVHALLASNEFYFID